jgi:hypothetical protein
MDGLLRKVTRQAGRHRRLTAQQSGEHQFTMPEHGPLQARTLAVILAGRTDRARYTTAA